MRRHHLTLALCLPALVSCITYTETVAIHFSSDPPGADVVVDGVPSGFATPCMIALEKEEQIVTFEKVGYQIPARRLYPDPHTETWFWAEATVGPHTFDFPTFINLDDFLQPVVTKNELVPGRVFVRLRRLADLAPAGEGTDENAEAGDSE
jgi:hypothetical protein